MADRARGDLPYGHFGTAVYDPAEQEWSFERLLDSPRTLSLIGEAQTVLPATFSLGKEASSDADSRRREVASVRHPKQIRKVVRANPDLQPATELLRPLLQGSETVEAAAARHDPMKGDLMCFGRIPDESLRRPARVAVIASGPTGGDVRFVQMQLQKQGWEDSKDVWLEVPVFAGEEAIWRGDGSPIQQVCFSSSLEGGDNLLAVRFITRTLIFRPFLQRLGPSRLVPNPVFEMPIGQPGVIPHSNVTFNPWFTRQFAIIDQRGDWSVHEFATKASSHAQKIHSYAWSETSPDRASDGWARISWIFSPNTIVMADRRRVALFDITTAPIELQDIDVGVTNEDVIILDMASLPSHNDRLCIVTTTHVLLMTFKENGKRDVEAHIAMRIRHYRSLDDISLRVSFFVDGADTMILLNSAFSMVTLTYRLALHADSITLRDVSELHTPPGFACRAGQLSIQNLEFAAKHGRGDSKALAGRLQSLGTRFLGLIALSSDDSVQQFLYLSHSQSKNLPHVNPPSWQGKTGARTSKLRDGFVVGDDSDDSGHLDGNVQVAKSPARRQRRTQNSASMPADGRTIDMHLSVEGLVSLRAKTILANAVLEQTRDLLRNTNEESQQPMQTVFEVAEDEIVVEDIDSITTQINELGVSEPAKDIDKPDTQETEQPSGLVVRPLSLPDLLPMMNDRQTELGSCYDDIVSLWISPLSTRIPGVVRLAKEQLARRMAAEVTLASHTFRHSISDEPSQPTQSTQPEELSQGPEQSWKLPVRRLPHAQASHSILLPAHSQQSVLPTPSPTGTPSVTTRFSQASSFAAAETSRLSRYTTFSKAAPSSTPRNLNKILSHWTLGDNPEDYDWLSTSRRITQQTEEEEADSQLTEKQRARLQRKADRHIRRQRREAAASQQLQIASSQMPELVVSASQPATRPVSRKQESQPGVAASQGVAASSQSVFPGPASQAVPGRYVGRMPVRKKRKQGF